MVWALQECSSPAAGEHQRAHRFVAFLRGQAQCFWGLQSSVAGDEQTDVRIVLIYDFNENFQVTSDLSGVPDRRRLLQLAGGSDSIHTVARCEADLVVFSVLNISPGLPTDAAAWVFGRFYATQTSGMAIGLLVYRTIVGLCSRLVLQQRARRGSTFTVTLPTEGSANAG